MLFSDGLRKLIKGTWEYHFLIIILLLDLVLIILTVLLSVLSVFILRHSGFNLIIVLYPILLFVGCCCFTWLPLSAFNDTKVLIEKNLNSLLNDLSIIRKKDYLRCLLDEVNHNHAQVFQIFVLISLIGSLFSYNVNNWLYIILVGILSIFFLDMYIINSFIRRLIINNLQQLT